MKLLQIIKTKKTKTQTEQRETAVFTPGMKLNVNMAGPKRWGKLGPAHICYTPNLLPTATASMHLGQVVFHPASYTH